MVRQGGRRCGPGRPHLRFLSNGMGMLEFLKSLLFGRRREQFGPPRFGAAEVARRLGMSESDLQSVTIAYTEFRIPKRGGRHRTVLAPTAPLKQVQRRIHRRLLCGLRAHPHATGFERGHSIVTNALPHAGKDVVIRLDLQDFFNSTPASRIHRYFRVIGYDEAAATLLTRLCTHEGSRPQGAPTSPRLSNLVNCRLDARLAALAAARGMSYSRYADDIAFSADETTSRRANEIIHAAKQIIGDEGYRLHTRRKLHISRRHHRQWVTGLVVNDRPNLPRATRRRLRAVAHHLRTGRPATLSEVQLAGWTALRSMIERQSGNEAEDREGR